LLLQQKLEKLQALVLTLLGDREIADENLPERRNSPERADISLESEHIATSGESVRRLFHLRFVLPRFLPSSGR